MAYIDPFLEKGFGIPTEDQEILNRWYEEEKGRRGWGLPKLLTFEGSMRYGRFCSWFDGFPPGKVVVLWEAENMSACGGYYYTGPLKGTVFLHEHEEKEAFAPQFLSLARFYDYYRRILRDCPEINRETGEGDYEDKFWHHIDFNGNQPLTGAETERFHLAACELLREWKNAGLGQEHYECTAYCAVAVLPDCYADELIPYRKPVRRDEYVLEAICKKLASAHCVNAIDAMRELWKEERAGFRIGGWGQPCVAGNALHDLLKYEP